MNLELLVTLGVFAPLLGAAIVGLSGRRLGDLVGQVFAMFVLTVAAAEAAIGLAILVIYFRNRGTIAVDDIHQMRG